MRISEPNLLFQSFWSLRSLSRFPPSGQLTKWTKFAFWRFLLTNAANNRLWVGYTFLQNFLSFKRFSILEENCGADIKNGAFKCNIFVDKCYKKGRWVDYTFPQKPRSFKFLSILEENCGANIINGTFKCKTFEFCCQMLQKRVVEWVILSHKNLFLLSVSAF